MTPSAGPIGARALSGTLELEFAGGTGGTRLAVARRSPPLSVQRAVRLDGHHPDLVTMLLLNDTAGLFADDRAATVIHVRSGAAVAFRTPAMSRVFAMREGSAGSTTRLSVTDASYCEYLPEPTLLCGGSSYRSALTAAVDDGSYLAMGEVTAFGRVAHGEAHSYRDVDQAVDVDYSGATVVAERVRASAGEGTAPGLFGGAAAVGTLYVVGPGTYSIVDDIRRLLAEHTAVAGGASSLPNDAGAAVRVFASSASAAQDALGRAVAAFRERYCATGAFARPDWAAPTANAERARRPLSGAAISAASR